MIDSRSAFRKRFLTGTGTCCIAATLLSPAASGALPASAAAEPHPAPPADTVAPAAGSTSPSESPALDVRDTRLRLTGERIAMPDPEEEPMGLFGLRYDLRPDDRWHLGLGGYGAVTGERGGFFTGGFQGGVQGDGPGPFQAEAGLFVGGGGGGSAPQGGGLMVRPHAAVGLDLSREGAGLDAVGVEASHVHFPNGGIESTQVGLFVEASWPALARPGHRTPEGPHGEGSSARSTSDRASSLPEEYRDRRRTLRFTAHRYWTHDGSLNTAGDRLVPTMGVVGFEYRTWLGDGLFAVLEPRGGAFGGTDGFAEITLGAGYTRALDREGRIHAHASGGIGGAGGGRVETGGGLLVRASAGMDLALPGPFSLFLDAGVQDAPTGHFRAWTAGVGLGTSEASPRPRSRDARPPEPDEAEALPLAAWRVRGGHLSYVDTPRRNAALHGERVDLFTLKFDRFVGRHLFITGQAHGAYAGGAGGYAVGLVGVGGRTPAWKRLRLVGEAALGASGGGGIEVGEGFILHPSAGLSVDLGPAWSLEMLGGWLLAPTGSGSRTPMLEVAASLAVSTPRLPDP